MGFLSLPGRDRAHLRRRRRRTVRDPDGRGEDEGRAAAIPGIGARRALRRERGAGNDGPEAGIREIRAGAARATAVLGPSPLELARLGLPSGAASSSPRPTGAKNLSRAISLVLADLLWQDAKAVGEAAASGPRATDALDVELAEEGVAVYSRGRFLTLMGVGVAGVTVTGALWAGGADAAASAPSAAQDQKILNFALFLEDLKSEFY